VSRLTRYARALLVANAALALTAAVTFAARDLTPTSDHSERRDRRADRNAGSHGHS
jgi:hypothetical protein